MSSTKIFEAIGDFLYNTIFLMYDNIGNLFNYSLIVLGFFGLFYWLRYQKKFNDQAANDPNQLK
jgi:hypothetical protein